MLDPSRNERTLRPCTVSGALARQISVTVEMNEDEYVRGKRAPERVEWLREEIGRHDGFNVCVDGRAPWDAGELGGGVGSWSNAGLPQT